MFPQSLPWQDIPKKFSRLKSWLQAYANLIPVKRSSDTWRRIYDYGTFHKRFTLSERCDIDVLALASEQAERNHRVFVVTNDEGMLGFIKHPPDGCSEFIDRVIGWIGGTFFSLIEGHYHYKFPMEAQWFDSAMELVTTSYMSHRQQTRGIDNDPFFQEQYAEAISYIEEIRSQIPDIPLRKSEQLKLLEWYFEWSYIAFDNIMHKIEHYRKKGILISSEIYKSLFTNWKSDNLDMDRVMGTIDQAIKSEIEVLEEFPEDPADLIEAERMEFHALHASNQHIIRELLIDMDIYTQRMIYDPRQGELPPEYLLRLMIVGLRVKGISYNNPDQSQIQGYFESMMSEIDSPEPKIRPLQVLWRSRLMEYRFSFDIHVTLPTRKRDQYFEFLCNPEISYSKLEYRQDFSLPSYEILTVTTKLVENAIYCPRCLTNYKILKLTMDREYMEAKASFEAYHEIHATLPKANAFPTIKKLLNQPRLPMWMRYYQLGNWQSIVSSMLGTVLKKQKPDRRPIRRRR